MIVWLFMVQICNYFSAKSASPPLPKGKKNITVRTSRELPSRVASRLAVLVRRINASWEWRCSCLIYQTVPNELGDYNDVGILHDILRDSSTQLSSWK